MSNILFKQKYSLALRLWHWLSGFVIFSLLLTILFRNTFFNSSDNSKIISFELQKSGTVISDNLAVSIAKSIRQPFWDWHYYFGFTLLALTLFRVSAFFLQRREYANSLSLSKLAPTLPKEEQKDIRYHQLVRKIYALYYFILTIMILTGLILYFKTDLALTKKISGTIKTVHEYTMWGIIVFILFHIIGVIKNNGIVSDMINGEKVKSIPTNICSK